MLKKLGIGLAALATIASGVYLLFIRPWHLRWGATDEEVHRSLPSDDLVPHPILKATRAITIRARATDIWLWLVQMGYGRAGWYSYDWIDNAGIHVTRIIPELQHIKVGDIMPTAPDGGFLVASVDPNRSLVLLIRTPDLQISSTFVLNEIGEQQTRLIIRLRLTFKPSLRAILYYLLFEPGDFVMMRKELLGIKQRVEQISQAAPDHVGETASSETSISMEEVIAPTWYAIWSFSSFSSALANCHRNACKTDISRCPTCIPIPIC